MKQEKFGENILLKPLNLQFSGSSYMYAAKVSNARDEVGTRYCLVFRVNRKAQDIVGFPRLSQKNAIDSISQ